MKSSLQRPCRALWIKIHIDPYLEEEYGSDCGGWHEAEVVESGEDGEWAGDEGHDVGDGGEGDGHARLLQQ